MTTGMQNMADGTFSAQPSTGGQDAHELWAMAQLVPGEGIEDGVRRIEAALAARQPVDLGQFRNAVKFWRRERARMAACNNTYTPELESSPTDDVKEADRLLALIDKQGGT